MAEITEKLRNEVKQSYVYRIIAESLDSLHKIVKTSFIYGKSREIHKTVAETFMSLDYIWIKKTSNLNSKISEGRLAHLLFSPYILVFIILFFFASSGVNLKSEALAVVFTGLLSLLVGILVGDKVLVNLTPKQENKGKIRATAYIIFSLSLLTLIYILWSLNGIPLLQPGLRLYLYRYVPLTYISWTVVPSAVFIIGLESVDPYTSCWREKRVDLSFIFLLTIISTVLLGFRTSIIAAFISGMFCLYLTRTYRFIDVMFISLAVFVLYFTLTGIRWGLTDVSLISKLVFARSSITTQTFELLVKRVKFNGYTRGAIQLAAISSVLKVIPGPRIGPRTIITNLIGGKKGVTTTCTIFGQMLGDFGLQGVFIESLIIGLILGLLFNKTRYIRRNRLIISSYSILMGYLAPGVETGILDFNVYVYFLASIAISLWSLVSCSLMKPEASSV